MLQHESSPSSFVSVVGIIKASERVVGEARACSIDESQGSWGKCPGSI